MKYIYVSILTALFFSSFEATAVKAKELEELRHSSPMRTRNHRISEPKGVPPAPRKQNVASVSPNEIPPFARKLVFPTQQ